MAAAWYTLKTEVAACQRVAWRAFPGYARPDYVHVSCGLLTAV
jgi:hypothetical protein